MPLHHRYFYSLLSYYHTCFYYTFFLLYASPVAFKAFDYYTTVYYSFVTFFSLQAVIAYIYLFSFDILHLYLHNNILTLFFYYFFIWNIFYITFSRIYILYKKIFLKNNLLKMQSWPPKKFYFYQNAVLTPPKTCLRTVCY